MISQADLKIIQTVFGKTAEEISGAISSEKEVSLDLRLNGRVVSQDEERTLKTTLTDAGIEIGYKKLAKEAGLTLGEGEKDAQVIVDKIKTNITTSLEDKYKNPSPGEKEKELEDKLSAEQAKYNKLFETHESTQALIEEKEKAYNGLQKEIKTKEHNNSVLKSLPEKMKFNKNHALIIVNNTITKEDSEGVSVYKRDGKTITDAVGNPEKLENIIPSLAEEFGWVKGSGMGGDDRNKSGSGLPKNMTEEQAYNYMTEKGLDPMTPKGGETFLELTSTE